VIRAPQKAFEYTSTPAKTGSKLGVSLPCSRLWRKAATLNRIQEFASGFANRKHSGSGRSF
jgi:hypothetical protein